MLLQRLTLPVASFATLYASIYVDGIPPTDEHANQTLALDLIAALLGYVVNVSSIDSRPVLMAWCMLTPAFSVAIWILLRAWLRQIFLNIGCAYPIPLHSVFCFSALGDRSVPLSNNTSILVT